MGRVCVTMPNFAINYLCNLLTDVDEIWHNDAYWSPAPDVRFIFFKFSTILYGGEPLSWESINCLNIFCNYTIGLLHYTISTIKQQIFMLKTAVYSSRYGDGSKTAKIIKKVNIILSITAMWWWVIPSTRFLDNTIDLLWRSFLSPEI